MAEVIPGTTWKGTPWAARSSSSSPPRPKRKGSPPLQPDHGVAPPGPPPGGCGRSPPGSWCGGWPACPTLTHRAAGGNHGQHLIPPPGRRRPPRRPGPGAPCPRRVINPPSPGPAPTRKTCPHHLPSPPSNSCRSLAARARPRAGGVTGGAPGLAGGVCIQPLAVVEPPEADLAVLHLRRRPPRGCCTRRPGR